MIDVTFINFLVVICFEICYSVYVLFLLNDCLLWFISFGLSVSFSQGSDVSRNREGDLVLTDRLWRNQERQKMGKIFF